MQYSNPSSEAKKSKDGMPGSTPQKGVEASNSPTNKEKQTGEMENKPDESAPEPEKSVGDMEKKLAALYKRAGFSDKDFDDLEGWEEQGDRSVHIAEHAAQCSKAEKDLREKLEELGLGTEKLPAETGALLKILEEQRVRLRDLEEEGVRRQTMFDARMVKFDYLLAVKRCEAGDYEEAASLLEMARVKRPKNEEIKELKRKLTRLRIVELEGEIEELRGPWWAAANSRSG